VVERWACGGGAWKAKLQRQRTDDSRTLTQPQLTTPTQKQGRARNCSGEARLPQLLPMPRRTLTAAVVLTTAVGGGGAIGARCFCARRMPVACRRNRIKGTRSMWIFAASPTVALSQTIGGLPAAPRGPLSVSGTVLRSVLASRSVRLNVEKPVDSKRDLAPDTSQPSPVTRKNELATAQAPNAQFLDIQRLAAVAMLQEERVVRRRFEPCRYFVIASSPNTPCRHG
jgi:hypothetical protein